jgi:predicted esterase
MMPRRLKLFALILGFCFVTLAAGRAQAPEVRPWSDAVAARLATAETNRLEIEKAFRQASIDRREGLSFLVANMPEGDLRTLSEVFLLENLNLAYDAWERSPWRASVSKEMFFNDILPYACLSEKRDPWRARLRGECEPLVGGCRTPGEAAQRLNQKLFPLLKVRYNTARRRPDQSPTETIGSGIATCTGLAILLVDACRSVGVPARVVGTPMWTNMRGNHTWVEVWDGDWHFVGAAEPDAAGLDHGWFVEDAAKAQRDVPQHAIYATSFGRTQVVFPLVWLPGDQSVCAVNVTDRYTPRAKPVAAQNLVRLAVKVLNAQGKRVAADVTVTDLTEPATSYKDQSRGETADLNDLASFQVVPGRKYHVDARLGVNRAESDVAIPAAGEQLITLTLAGTLAGERPPLSKRLPTKDAASLSRELSGYFAADGAKQAAWKFPARLEKLLREDEPAVRQIAWEAYRAAPIHPALKADFEAKVARFEQHVSPYTVKAVGTRPANGWPLFIALHGGGGAPKAVNDSQWKQMQSYYREHAELGGYLYLALRAPNDTWNGFYDHYVYPLVDNLIRQFRLFADIDPDKVFIMGYSHGGYGAYAIGPKMPDRFAAIHASAAAATDGETSAKTLRTTPFSAMVGEHDTMYGRYERNLKFQQEIERLRGGRTDIYPVTVTIVKGNGHTGLPDRDQIKELYPAVRNPVPREVTWLMTDPVVKDFFWLHVPQPGQGQEILASCRDNRLVLTANASVTAATVLTDTRLVDLSKPVDIELNGSTVTRHLWPSLKTLCDTLVQRGDPSYAFSAELKVAADANGCLRVTSPAK